MSTSHHRTKSLACVLIALFGAPRPTHAQGTTPPPVAQSPSPMTEETRPHGRLAEKTLHGSVRSFIGPAGKPVNIFVPHALGTRKQFNVVVHFLGPAWLAEQAVAAVDRREVAVVLNLGAGSSVYDRAFTDAAAFDSLLAGITREVTAATGHPSTVGAITLAGFSAGYGAVRAILREPRHFARVSAVLLLDGLHTSYVPEGMTLATGGVIDSLNLLAFRNFAQAAMRGEKRFLVTHSEIFPGTYASTTETATWILRSVGIHQRPVLRAGPGGMQQLSEARAGHFEIMGYAGNSGPDHVDQLHGMPTFLARLMK